MNRNVKIGALAVILMFLIPVQALPVGEETTQKPGGGLKWSGYGQVQYDGPAGGVDGFRMRRARMGLTWSPLGRLSAKLMVETLQNPVLLDFQLDWSIAESVGLRFGQFKVPFSFENLQSSADLDTINRSQAVERLCPGRDNRAKGRDIGAAVKGSVSEFQYAVGIFNGSGIDTADSDSSKDLAGRLVFVPSRSFGAGLSHYRGHTADPGIEKIRTGLEAFGSLKNIFFRGEAIFGRDGAVDRLGWYVLAGWDVLDEKLRLVARYDALEMNRDQSGALIDTMTMGAVWILARRIKILANWEWRKDRPAGRDQATFLAQFQAAF